MKTNANRTEGTEYISKDIVRLLKDQYGWTLKKIGEAIDCGESFVSMVGSGRRSFTLDHLAMLEKKLGEPVAILLLKSIDPEKVDKELRPLYSRFISRVSGKRKVKARRKRKAAMKIKRHNTVTRVTA